MSSVRVFGSPTSAEVARVLACLFEKDVEFQLIRVENYKGREKRPEYLKLQLAGQALTYEEGKVTLVDSRVICRHISEKYANQGNKDLLGTGTLERASIEQWLQTEANSFDPPSSVLVFNLAFTPRERENGKAVQESMHKLEEVLNIYEQRLEEMQYLAGDKFTLADLSHLPNAHRLVSCVPKCAKMFEERKKVSRWWEAISSRSSWRKVVEMMQEPTCTPDLDDDAEEAKPATERAQKNTKSSGRNERNGN